MLLTNELIFHLHFSSSFFVASVTLQLTSGEHMQSDSVSSVANLFFYPEILIPSSDT